MITLSFATLCKPIFTRDLEFPGPSLVIGNPISRILNFGKLLKQYGLDHRIETTRHPQMRGHVEVFNWQIKQICIETARMDRKDWSTKLAYALWASRITYKTSIGKAKKLALCEIKELRDEAYECALAYKAKMKKVRDAKIQLNNFEIGQRVWFYITRMKLFPGNLKSKGTGSYSIVGVGNHGQYEIEDFDDLVRQVVNGYRLKPYLELEDIHNMDKESVSFLVTSPVYEDN
ncbi:uncharacterized protein LOC143571739 [Bidens hawaiensis]|uniref:uncharacterized protein LOC143571739 n=1 Tax=Bidens hawaiensis TaxID=980011 RepID=UPI00404A5FF3